MLYKRKERDPTQHTSSPGDPSTGFSSMRMENGMSRWWRAAQRELPPRQRPNEMKRPRRTGKRNKSGGRRRCHEDRSSCGRIWRPLNLCAKRKAPDHNVAPILRTRLFHSLFYFSMRSKRDFPENSQASHQHVHSMLPSDGQSFVKNKKKKKKKIDSGHPSLGFTAAASSAYII